MGDREGKDLGELIQGDSEIEESRHWASFPSKIGWMIEGTNGWLRYSF